MADIVEFDLSIKAGPLFTVQIEQEFAPKFTLNVGNGASSGLSGGGGSDFLADPEFIDESDAIYFYFGWTSISGSWLVQRQTRATGITETATISNNSGEADIAAAWANRVNILYI